jgi:hypothetical protein
MLNLSQTLEKWEYLWRKQNVIYWAFGWAALSLFTYVFFSGSAQSTDRPLLYRIFTAYFLENIPLLVAGILCIRNGLSRRMPSGSQVWLLIGIALIAYFVGNIFFSSWELVWHLNSTGSLGDPFFMIFYICLSLAMLIAITSKRIRLKMYQWAIVLGIGAYAAMIAMWILNPVASPSIDPATPVTIVQNSATSSTTPTIAPSITESLEPANTAPGWVMFCDGIFKPYGSTLNSFYVWSDVVLFIMAIIMILAFWGGRLSKAWQVNAQAIVCYYIGDMWLAYASNHINNYQTGFLLEVFWILGAIQFGVAAGLEFEHMLARKKDDVVVSPF